MVVLAQKPYKKHINVVCFCILFVAEHVSRLELVVWSLCTFGFGIVGMTFLNFCLSVSAVLSLMLILGIRSSDGCCEVMS